MLIALLQTQKCNNTRQKRLLVLGQFIGKQSSRIFTALQNLKKCALFATRAVLISKHSSRDNLPRSKTLKPATRDYWRVHELKMLTPSHDTSGHAEKRTI